MELAMKNIIVEILNDIDEDIVSYKGDNLLDDGIIDSFTIVEIISEIEDRFNITISPERITAEHFETVEAIIQFVELLINREDKNNEGAGAKL